MKRWSLGVVAALALSLAGCGGAHHDASGSTSNDRPPAGYDAQISSGDHRLHFYVVGDPMSGTPIVAIPGGPGLSHHYLLPLSRLAQQGRAVVFLDPRGVAPSTPGLAKEWTLDDYAADIEAVRVSLGAERIHLVGHSFGGIFALSYAATHAERLASLVLIESVPPDQADLFAANARYFKRMKALVTLGIVPEKLPAADASCMARIRAIAPTWYSDPRHSSVGDFGRTTCSTRVGGPTTKGLGAFDLRPRLGAVRAPVLVVVATGSPFGVEMSDATVSALASAQVDRRVLRGCGHIPWSECPRPFFDAVTMFLDGH